MKSPDRALVGTDILRFIDKIEFTGYCWRFKSAIDRNGYGLFWHNGSSRIAHRLSYLTWRGCIPDGLVLDHVCETRNCVNPDHLEPMTQAENIRQTYGNRPGYCRADLHDLTIPGARHPSRRYCYACYNLKRRK